MKAIGVETVGSLSALSEFDVPLPEPKADEVRVRVHAASVNPADVKVVRGDKPARFLHAKVSPLVPGYDLSGVIDAVGSRVTDWVPGDCVFGHLPYNRRAR